MATQVNGALIKALKTYFKYRGDPSVTLVSDANVSDPPTAAELNSAFDTPANLPEGFIGIVDDNGAGTDVWLAVVSNGSWRIFGSTAAGSGHNPVTLSTDLDNNLLDITGQALDLDSQTANTVFAAPDGAGGKPSFRSLVLDDLPFIGLEDNAGAAITPAGDGRIQFTDDGVINVDDDGSGNGLALSLSTPGTLSVSSANAAVAAHTHAISTSSDPGAGESILATDTAGSINLQYLDFDEISTPASPGADEARLFAVDEQGVTGLSFLDSDGFVEHLGEDIYEVVRNVTGAAMSQGDVVYLSGETGNVSEVSLARADSLTTMPAAGILAEDIADNGYGRMMLLGTIEGFDTSSFVAGDDLYVSASTAGAFANSKPGSGNIVQQVGHVHVSGVGNGKIQVNIYNESVSDAVLYSNTSLQSDANGYLTLSRLQIRDTALFVGSTADGQLDIDADGTVEMVAPTITLSASTRVNIPSGPLDLAGTLEFQGSQSITTTSGDVTLAPVGDIKLDPAGQQVIFANWNSGDSIESDDYVSQTTGWAISYGSSGGDADFRNIFADELHVQAFIADVYQSLVGAIIITKSRGRLSRDFTVPATGNTGTLYVEDLEGFENTAVFAANDNVRLRYVDTSGGGLVVTDVWGTVSSYTDETGGEQSWTFTCDDDGGVSGSVVYTGSIALDYGQSGDGLWEATVLDSAGSPYSQVTTWTTDPTVAGNFTTHTRIGNLDGISGIGAEFGIWAGTGTGATDQQVVLSDSQVTLKNLDLAINDGSNDVIELDHTAGLYVSNGAWGTDTSVFAAVIADDIITEFDANDVLIGTYFHSVSDSQKGIHWDDSQNQLRIKGDLVIGAGTGFILNDVAMLLHFDGPRPYASDFQVNTNGHLGQEATVTGGVIGRPGKFGKSFQAAEAVTNLITNPSFETGVSGWTNGTGTISQSSVDSYYGSYSALIDGYEVAYATISPGGTTVTMSAWVRVVENTNSQELEISIRDSGGTRLASYTLAAGEQDGEWHRVQVTSTTGTPARAYIGARGSNVGGTVEVYFDAIQVEENSYATPYCDGSLGDGHSWSGTAHASTSSRTDAFLEYDNPVDISDEGTVACWIYREDWSDTFAANRGVFDIRVDAGNTVRAYTNSSGILAIQYVGDSTGVDHTVSAATLSAGWHHIAITWSSDEIAIYLDGVQETVDSTPSLAMSNPSTLRVGSLGFSTLPWNGRIDDFLASDTQLSATDIETIYESGAPVVAATNNQELLLTGEDRGKIVGHAGGLFGTAADGTESFALINEDSMPWDGSTYDAGDMVLGSNVSGSSAIIWDKSAGKFGFYGGGSATVQVEIATDGSILAGGGDVKIDGSGIQLLGLSGTPDTSKIKFEDTTFGSGIIASIYSDPGLQDTLHIDSDDYVDIDAGGNLTRFRSTDVIFNQDVRIVGGLFSGSSGTAPSTGSIGFSERSSDPTEPKEGEAVIWMSDGTGKGADGDVMIASQAGGVTRYATLFDHSAGSAW